MIFKTSYERRKEAVKEILRNEFEAMLLRDYEAQVWLDIENDEITTLYGQQPDMQSRDANAGIGRGFILLWSSRSGAHSLTDLINAIKENSNEAPFYRRSFIEWYLIENFKDKIQWGAISSASGEGKK